jgi:hypothetical protein
MDIATISAGLTFVNTASTLLRNLRDGLKSGEIKQDELPGRIGEIYDCLNDSKAALLDSKDEMQQLQSKVRSLQDEKDFRDSLTYDVNGLYRRKTTSGVEEVYCSACLDGDNKRVRTTEEGPCSPPSLVCYIHGYRGLSSRR